MNLYETLSSSDAILFVGSGVSAWSGLPSWWKLVDELADYLDHHGINSKLMRIEAKNGDLLQSASYGFSKLTRHQQGEFVRSACRYGSAKPSELHRALAILGPKCFITTNYDNLIEEALRLWRPDEFFRPPVTNRDLVGMPEIVQARAINFIFKPHGDAADTDSIVLTREQYRMLMPGGERQATLESLKLLLVSRPVVYVGFGLRDPDFLYLKDVLLNIYRGGTRDHFALMADVSEEQISYWRQEYGIHLVSYQTSLNDDGSKNHDALLRLLEVACSTLKFHDSAQTNSTDSKLLLSLARYASSLTQEGSLVNEFAIRVNSARFQSSNVRYEWNEFEGAKVDTLLDRFKTSIALIGLPGAGKSYALRRSVARQAEKLHAACLSDKPDAADFVIPIFADLKLYQGSLEQLISASLPAGLDFSFLLRNFAVKVYLDSFNELPRKFVESGECEADLEKFLKVIKPAAVVIGSRTLDGLEALGFETYELNAIDEPTVIQELESRNISIVGRFQPEMLELLQRPFFFRYVLSGEISLPSNPHPKEFYRLLLEEMSQALAVSVKLPLDLPKILRSVAYKAMNSGEEAYLLTTLLQTIAENFAQSGVTDVTPSQIANGLVSCSLLVPYSGGRIAFVHQSITEYLASLELAEHYVTEPELLREKISLRRWDQALFLTLSHLQSPLDQKFVRGVLDIELSLALAAAKFVETGRDQLVSDLLDELIRRKDVIEPQDWALERALGSGFPVTALHLPKLEKMANSSHPLRTEAVKLVIALRGADAKDEYLKYLIKYKDDYNFCVNVIGPALAPFAVDNDLQILGEWCRELDAEVGNNLDGLFDEDGYEGFIGGVDNFCANLSLSAARLQFFPSSPDELKRSPVRTAVLQDILRSRRTSESLKCVLELLLLGDPNSAYSIYSIVEFARPRASLDLGLITELHMEALFAIYRAPRNHREPWAWDAIDGICKYRPDLRPIVELRSEEFSSLPRACLLKCARQDEKPVFDALVELLSITDDALQDLEFSVLSHMELNWKGREALLLSLLARRCTWLSKELFGTGVPIRMRGLDKIEFSDLNWWLDWLSICHDSDYWLARMIASFLGRYATDDLVHRLVAEANNPKSNHRTILFSTVFLYFPSITTDDLSSEAHAFAINNLLQSRSGGFQDYFLGSAATESFAKERLLPLLTQVGEMEERRIRLVLKEAGQRHGTRYF